MLPYTEKSRNGLKPAGKFMIINGLLKFNKNYLLNQKDASITGYRISFRKKS